MPIRRKIAPNLSSNLNIDSLVGELNKIIIEIYQDINVMENKLSLYLNMIQDSQSGTLGNLRLTKKVTSDKTEDLYQLLGKADEGYVMIADDLEPVGLTEEVLAMDIGVKNIDTDKPRYAKRTK